MDNDEAEKKIKEAVDAGRVRFADSDGVDSFTEVFVDEFLLEICGVDEAWISDQSGLWDFGCRNEETYAKIEKRYGVDVRGKDNLLEIFRTISTQNRTVQ